MSSKSGKEIIEALENLLLKSLKTWLSQKGKSNHFNPDLRTSMLKAIKPLLRSDLATQCDLLPRHLLHPYHHKSDITWPAFDQGIIAGLALLHEFDPDCENELRRVYKEVDRTTKFGYTPRKTFKLLSSLQPVPKTQPQGHQLLVECNPNVVSLKIVVEGLDETLGVTVSEDIFTQVDNGYILKVDEKSKDALVNRNIKQKGAVVAHIKAFNKKEFLARLEFPEDITIEKIMDRLSNHLGITITSGDVRKEGNVAIINFNSENDRNTVLSARPEDFQYKGEPIKTGDISNNNLLLCLYMAEDFAVNLILKSIERELGITISENQIHKQGNYYIIVFNEEQVRAVPVESLQTIRSSGYPVTIKGIQGKIVPYSDFRLKFSFPPDSLREDFEASLYQVVQQSDVQILLQPPSEESIIVHVNSEKVQQELVREKELVVHINPSATPKTVNTPDTLNTDTLNTDTLNTDTLNTDTLNTPNTPNAPNTSTTTESMLVCISPVPEGSRAIDISPNLNSFTKKLGLDAKGSYFITIVGTSLYVRCDSPILYQALLASGNITLGAHNCEVKPAKESDFQLWKISCHLPGKTFKEGITLINEVGRSLQVYIYKATLKEDRFTFSVADEWSYRKCKSSNEKQIRFYDPLILTGRFPLSQLQSRVIWYFYEKKTLIEQEHSVKITIKGNYCEIVGSRLGTAANLSAAWDDLEKFTSSLDVHHVNWDVPLHENTEKRDTSNLPFTLSRFLRQSKLLTAYRKENSIFVTHIDAQNRNPQKKNAQQHSKKNTTATTNTTTRTTRTTTATNTTTNTTTNTNTNTNTTTTTTDPSSIIDLDDLSRNFLSSDKSKSPIQILIVGTSSNELLQTVGEIRNLGSSILTCTKPIPKLKFDIKPLESKYDVCIALTDNSMSFSGLNSNVTDTIAEISGSNQTSSVQIRGKSYYQFISPKFTELKSIGVNSKLSRDFKYITLSGPLEKLTEAKSVIQSAVNQIKILKFKKDVSRVSTRSLGMIKAQIDSVLGSRLTEAEFTTRVVPDKEKFSIQNGNQSGNSSPNNRGRGRGRRGRGRGRGRGGGGGDIHATGCVSGKTEGEEEKEGDDGYDTAYSDSQVSDSEIDEETDADENEDAKNYRNKFAFVSVTYNSEKNTEIIKSLIEPLEIEYMQIKNGTQKALQQLPISKIMRNTRAIIVVKFPFIHIRSMVKSHVDAAYSEIQQFLDNRSVETKKKRLPGAEFSFIQARCRNLLQTFKKNYELHNLSFDKPSSSIIMTGSKTAVREVMGKLDELLNTLDIMTITFPPDTFVNDQIAHRVKKELEESNIVQIKLIKKEHKIVEAQITYEKQDSSINDVKAELETIPMKKDVLNFKLAEFTHLYSTFIEKKSINIKEFNFEWNVELRFDYDSKKLTILSRNEDDRKGAEEALRAIIENTSFISKSVPYSPKYLHDFIQEIFACNQFKAKLEKDTMTKINLFKREIKIRGTKDNTEKAAAAINKKISELKQNFRSKQVNVDSVLAQELTKNWKICTDFYKQTKIYINFPEFGKTRVLSELQQGGFTLQIVEGNIVHEPVDCIVNAANEKLEHNGGIAKIIASKAGEEFVKECAESIARNGPIPTGMCRITSGGQLVPKFVIHCVGPVWNGGVNNEREILKNAIKNVLIEAHKNNITSISIPAISSGIFGVPKEICTEAIIKAIIEFISQYSHALTKLIRLCDIDQTILGQFRHFLHTLSSEKVKDVSNLSISFDIAYQWSFLTDDKNVFQNFDPDQNYQIELDYLAYCKGKGPSKITVKGDFLKMQNSFDYEIDFVNMTEVNTKLRWNYRKLQRVPKEVTKSTWMYKGSTGWTNFSEIDNRELEYYYSMRNQFPSVKLQNSFFIDFIKMTALQQGAPQIPISIKRMDYEERADEVLDSIFRRNQQQQQKPEMDSSNFMETVVELITLNLNSEAPARDPEPLFQELLNSLQTSATVVLESESQTEEICKIARKFNVKVQLSTDKQLMAVLKGIPDNVNQAKIGILDFIRDNLQSSGNVKLPPTWTPQTETCVLKPVDQGTSEWNAVETQLKETIPTAVIQKIERVQNHLMYVKFEHQRIYLTKKLGKKPQERALFHGTRRTEPKEIYTNETGFNLQYANDGLWGRALYFAVNASYSNNYSFNLGQSKQIFLTTVLVGDVIRCPQDKNLKNPPVKSFGAASICYDSVEGFTGGSVVYMVYENGRAYPDYLITYV